MYTPKHFQMEDPASLAGFMRRHSFATIVTHDGAVPHATHMPVIYNEKEGTKGLLVSHMARANPQWRHFADGREVLVIFQGPHAYVSPAWYKTQPAVPTWNYTAVHAYGLPVIIEDKDRFAAMLHQLVETFEAPRTNRWDGVMPDDYRDKLMAGIVGIEIAITRVEGKFKLSQNRLQEDIDGVVSVLSQSADQTERELAALMTKGCQT